MELQLSEAGDSEVRDVGFTSGPPPACLHEAVVAVRGDDHMIPGEDPHELGGRSKPLRQVEIFRARSGIATARVVVHEDDAVGRRAERLPQDLPGGDRALHERTLSDARRPDQAAAHIQEDDVELLPLSMRDVLQELPDLGGLQHPVAPSWWSPGAPTTKLEGGRDGSGPDGPEAKRHSKLVRRTPGELGERMLAQKQVRCFSRRPAGSRYTEHHRKEFMIAKGANAGRLKSLEG